MPKASRDSASETITLEGLEVHLEHLDGGYTVCFESHHQDADMTALLRGMPDDRCDFPRWGYVIHGAVDFRFADHSERYEAGDAYFVAPGHIPHHEAGCEIVEFSPTEPLARAISVVMSNVSEAASQNEVVTR